MIRRLTGLALAVFALCCPIAIYIGLRLVAVGPAPQQPSPAELVSVLLTFVTIVLALLALIVAGLAIWGYQGIKTEAALAAERAIQTRIDEYFRGDDGRARIGREIDKRIEELVSKRVDALRYPSAFANASDIEEGQQRAVQDYPSNAGAGPEPPYSGNTSIDQTPSD